MSTASLPVNTSSGILRSTSTSSIEQGPKQPRSTVSAARSISAELGKLLTLGTPDDPALGQPTIKPSGLFDVLSAVESRHVQSLTSTTVAKQPTSPDYQI